MIGRVRTSAGAAPCVAVMPLAVGPVDLEAHEPDPERGRHGVGHRGQLLDALVGVLEGGGQPGHDVVRRVALAEDPSPHGGGEPLPQRPVQHDRQQQHDQHDLALVEAVVEHGTEAGDDREVDGDERQREEREDQRCR